MNRIKLAKKNVLRQM